MVRGNITRAKLRRAADLSAQRLAIEELERRVLLTAVAFPTPYTAVAPPESLIYTSSITDGIFSSGDIRSYSTVLRAGEAATAVIHPINNPALRASATVSGPSGQTIVAQTTAPAAGVDLVIGSFSAPTAGTYTVNVTAAASTTGQFSIELILNAAAELESHGGASNDGLAGAQNIDAAFGSLAGSAQHAGVLGTTDPLPSTPTNPAAPFSAYSGNLDQLAIAGSLSSGSDADWFAIGTLHAGDVLSGALHDAEAFTYGLDSGVLLLYRSGGGGTPVTSGIVSPTDGSNDFARFPIAQTDTYYIRVSSSTADFGTYQLALFLENNGIAPVTGGATPIDSEPNDTQATASDISGSWKAVQDRSATQFQINFGDTVTYNYQFNAGDWVTFDMRAMSSGLSATLTGNGMALNAEPLPGNADPYIYTLLIPATGTYSLNLSSVQNGTGYQINSYLSPAVPLPPPPADNYAVTLAAGQTLSAALAANAGGVVHFQIFDPQGNVVVLPTGRISEFVAGASGVYVIQVAGDPSKGYNLELYKGASFDSGFNLTYANAQRIDPDGVVVGIIAQDNRYYRFNALAGNSITITTSTPSEPGGEFANNFDAHIDLFDANANILGSDDNSAGDGRNAKLTYTVPAGASGLYTVHVSGFIVSSGLFALSVTGLTDPPTPATPDLLASSDSGISSTDNVTKLNNHSPQTELQFAVPNTLAGATVTLFSDGVAIGSALASGSTTIITTNGTVTLSDNNHLITAQQSLPGGITTPPSPSLWIGVQSVLSGQAGASTFTFTRTPAGLSTTNVSTPTFAVYSGNGVYYHILQDGVQVTSDYEDKLSFTSLPLPDGVHTFTFIGIDIAGNLAVPTQIQQAIDTSTPTITHVAAPDATIANVTSYTFTVSYNDVGVGFDANSASGNPVQVTGPHSFSALANGTTVQQTGPSSYDITYAFTPPGGAWVYTSDGIYTITLLDHRVRDYADNFIAGATIGTFNVAADGLVAPDMDDASDTGSSPFDNYTSHNNSTTSKSLRFVYNNMVPHAVITAYYDGILIGTSTNNSSLTLGSITSDGHTVIPDGVHQITLRETPPGGQQSGDSPPLTITVDTVAPAAPPVPVLDPQSDNGISNTDGITSLPSPAIDVVASVAGVLHLTVNGTLAGPSLPVAAPGTYQLSNWFGSASLTFKARSASRATSVPAAVVDLTGDGIPDVLLQDSSTNIIEGIGNGDGTFTFKTLISAPSGSLFVGDLNHDNKQDLICGLNGTMTAFLGNGDGTFAAGLPVSSAGLQLQWVGLANENADAYPDLIAFDSSNARSVVLLGNGNGTFQSPLGAVNATGGPVIFADVNHDGIADFISAGTVYLGRGNGTFGTGSPDFQNGVGSLLKVADLNGDGKTDIIGMTVNNILISLGNGDGTFQNALKLPVSSVQGLAAADFDRDGHVDLVTTVFDLPLGSNEVALYRGNGDGTFQPAQEFTAPVMGAILNVADLNADGRMDLLISGNASMLGTSGPLVNGTTTVAAWAEDLAGNRSATGPSTTITGQFTPPTATLAASNYSVNEGGSVQIGVASSSPSAVTYQWDFNYNGTTFNPSASGQNVSFNASAIDGPATRTVALRVGDVAGNTALVTATVNIQNVAPTAKLTGGVYGLGFSGTVVFNSPVDPSAADVAAGLSYSYDFNNDGVFDVTGSTSSTAVIPVNDLSTLGDHTVRGRISDKDGGFTDYLTTITIAPPAAVSGTVFGDTNANGTREAGESGVGGVTVYLDANGNGQLDSGEPSTSTDANGNYNFPVVQLSTNFAVQANLPTGWTITGGDGAANIALSFGPNAVIASLDFGVQSPPLANLGGLYAVSEGSQVMLDAAGSSEVGGTIVKYEWDTNYNGTTFVARATGVQVPFSAVGLDGTSIRTIALRVTDTRNGTAIVAGSVSIANAPPTAFFTAGPDVVIGSAGSVAFSGANDPSPADVTGGFKYSYDFDNNGTFEITNSTLASATVPASYLSTLGAHTIHGRIIDKDGGTTDYTTALQVNAGTASIAGEVFNDANNNAKLDSGELGIGGWTVYIDTNNNSILDASETWTNTASNGSYAFSGVAAGAYLVRAKPQTGYAQTLPVSNFAEHVTVTAGQAATAENFGEHKTTALTLTNSTSSQRATISGILFDDANANGRQDRGEIGLSGWTVFIDSNYNGKLDPGETSLKTDSSGHYRFVVPAGAYKVRELLKTGYRRTTASGVYLLTLSSGMAATGKNFGNR